MALYAKIIISISHKDVDREFDYIIPNDLRDNIEVGSRVLVPFGKNNKSYEGYVVRLCDTIDFPQHKAKHIVKLLDNKPIISQELINLAFYMKEKYYTTFSTCIKCIVPTGISIKSDFIIQCNEIKEELKISKAQKKILDYIIENDRKVLLSEIEIDFGKYGLNTINSFEKLNYVSRTPTHETKNLSLKLNYAYLNYNHENIDEILYNVYEENDKQYKVIKFLMENDGSPITDIKIYLNISDSPIKTLVKKNIVYVLKKEVMRNVVYTKDIQKTYAPKLTDDQNNVINFIKNKKDIKPVLLHGVTGSGKTEIYLNLIEDVVAKGECAIVLVPEISLTSQVVDIFLKRFGSKVSVTHSRLSIGERYDQWQKAIRGDIQIMVGPRSALFTPFKKLGIIIIDEEHENTYKSETTPKYSAIEVGIERARLANCNIVLGSATPSIDSYFKVQNKIYDIVTINQRINKTTPKISVVDMRKELENGNKSMFSNILTEEISKNIKKGEQTILFLNRRGHSTFVSCRKCGCVLQCENCNVNYTYHININKLTCHYCGKKEDNPKNCPTCGSNFIKYFGVGTQKIEDEVKRVFPSAKVLRMDMDTTKLKHSHEKIINEFRAGNAQILIGTQMIAKGLDFPNVTLVGVIAADLSLNNGDYRAGEITYQLLTQISGRAGRSKLEGRVYIQTYDPQHYSIVFAKENNYKEFYNHEISLRRQMNYPPFSNVFNILLVSFDEKKVIKSMFTLLDIMNFYNRKGLFEMLGPSPALISKIKNKYRWRLIVKCEDEEKIKLFVIYCLDKLKDKEDLSNININITLNPSML
jgi:primosomal protein N' (replication factor Y) (superfamily II helicase)